MLLSLSKEDRLEIMEQAIKFSSENTNAPTTFFSRIGNIVKTYYLSILKGVGYTILVAIVGTIVGLFIGLLIGMYRTLGEPSNKALQILKK